MQKCSHRGLQIFICFALTFALVPPALSVDPHFPLMKSNIAVNNLASIQRGAKYFVNYCLSCHSAKYSRYQHIADDLGIPTKEVEKYLIFTNNKIGDLMTIAMTDEESTSWFGAAPPDLTLLARSRSPDWLYTYLRSFYLDDTRPLGVNNALYQNVAMPHVLWELQGWQKPIYKKIKSKDGNEHERIVGFEQVSKGTMSSKEYDLMLHDLVGFMEYLSEPSAHQRKAIRNWVLFFLLLFFAVAYALKHEYWKDIH